MQIQEKEFVYLIGKVGSGKSSLLKTMYGELDIHSGEARVLGYDMAHIRRKQIPALRKRIGIVFQDFRLIDTMTVYDNVAFGLKLKKMDKKVIEKKVKHALKTVGMTDYEYRDVSSLRGGQQQRVALIRALCQPYDFLLLDEPISHLDDKNSNIMRDIILREAGASGAAVIATSIGKHMNIEYDKILRL